MLDTRSPARAALLLLLLALLLAACTGDRAALDRRREAAAAKLPGDPLVAAAAAEVDAAEAESGPSVVDQVELRLGSRLGGELATTPPSKLSDTPGGSLEIAGRLPMDSPFEVAASARARDANVAGAVARLEGVALQVEGERCAAAVAHHAYAERKRLYDAFAVRLGSLLAWNEEWGKAASLDELAAVRFELEGKRLLEARVPQPAPEEIPQQGALAAHPLPPLARPGGALLRSEEAIRAELQRHDPSVAARAAAWERYQALSDQAFHASMPWLSYVQGSVEPFSPEGAASFTAQLGIAFPLGAKRGEEERLAAEGLRNDKELEASELAQLRRVQVALEELARFEERGPRLDELVATAERAEQIADRWLQGRREEPAKVGALFEQNFEARAAVIAARERAGLAGCALLGMTGVSPATWPRER